MTKPKIIICAVAAFIIIATLFLPPFFGKADDGSFFMTLTENGLYNLEGADTSFFAGTYGISPTAGQENEFFPITIAKVLGGFWSTAFFDIRLLALLYIPFYLIGGYLIIKAIRIKNPVAEICISAFVALILVDIGYISYMNSLYTDALYLCGILLMLGSVLNMHRGDCFYIPSAVFFVLSSAMLTLKGISGCIVAVICAAALIGSAFMDERTKKSVLTSGICGLLAAVIFCGGAPTYVDEAAAAYSSVFDGAVRVETDAAKSLEKLGISQKYEKFSGVSYYEAMEKNPAEITQFRNEEAEKVSGGKILGFYLSNPSKLAKAFSDAGKNAPFLTQSYIKNEQNMSYGIKKAPGVWSWLRRFTTPASFWIWLILSLLVFVMAIATFKKDALMSVAGIFLSVANIVFFAEPILRSGLTSISRNLFLHQVAGDMMLLLIICYGVNFALDKRQQLQQKYGVNQ